MNCSLGVLCSCTLGLLLLMFAPPARADEPAPGRRQAPAPAGQADAALRGLFAPARASVDPDVADLAALLRELDASPLAASAGKLGLVRARTELGRLRQLIAAHAPAQRLARQKQLVWAALSLVDRQLARAAAATGARGAAPLQPSAASEGSPPPPSASASASGSPGPAEPGGSAGWSREQAARVAALAPDFLARAERAAARARTAGALPSAHEEAAIAELLRAAALAEADRVELERALLARSLEQDALARASAAERRQLSALEAERRRARDRRAAELAAERFLPASRAARPARAPAPASHAPEPPLRPAGGPPPTAAGFLADRARLTLAAARALGAEPARLERLAATLPALRSERAARAALAEAERLIPPAPGPDVAR